MSEGARKSLDSSMCTITCSEELEQLPGLTSGFVPKQDDVGCAEAELSVNGTVGGQEISLAFPCHAQGCLMLLMIMKEEKPKEKSLQPAVNGNN